MSGLIDAIVGECQAALETVVEAMADDWARPRLFEEIGVDPAVAGDAGFVAALAALRTAAEDLTALRAQPALTLASIRAVLNGTRAALTAVRALGTTAVTAYPALGVDLITTRAMAQLAGRLPELYQLAVMLGVIDAVTVERLLDGPRVVRELSLRDRFDFDRLAALFSDPVAMLRAQLSPTPLATAGDAATTADFAVERLRAALAALGLPWRYGYPTEDETRLGDAAHYARRMLLVQVPAALADGASAGFCLGLSAADEDDLGVVVTPVGALSFERELPAWFVSLSLSAAIEAFAFGGGAGFRLLASPGTASVELSAQAVQAPVGETRVIGAERGTRLELSGTRFHAGATLSAAQRSVELEFELDRGALVLTSDGGDGFLNRVLGDRELRAEFDFGVVYSSGRGLRFSGGAGLEVRIPAGGTLGPLTLDEIAIALEVSAEALRLVASCGVQVKLGPVQVRVDGVGTQLVAIFPAESPARDFDLDFDFRPPVGAGFAIDAGPVRGSGYLHHSAGRYTGALALDALGLSFSAIGVLDTHVAGSGYSLAAVVCAEFQPVQLGLGFTLDGVGGLIGIHRRVDTDALRAALRGPGIGDIFFAADPIGQAARLTGDLGRYFPVAEGRHVFGPAVKLGWGTPTIITAKLAVLLELPSPIRIVMLGSVRAALPTQDHPIIDLHVDVVGEIDFAEKRIAIDASLRDSTIAGFAITGDLAFRMRWGDAPSFALAIGGFHSQFRAPPGFPALRRIAIPIGSGDDPRLDIQGFLALTSNTAQVGAQAELYASAGPLNIRGSLGFETLIVFSPFSLEVDVWAGVKLRRGNSTLAGIHFDGRIKGPGPWRIDGKATLSLWFIDLSVSVHVTFGQGQPVELPARTIWPLLQAAVAQRESWSTALPSGMHAIATAAPAGQEAVRVDPGAALTLRQSVAPLGRRITRFAQGRPVGTSEFAVSAVRLAGAIAPSTPVMDWFAPAQFEELTDADKLSRPGFERMTAGLTVGGAALRAGTPHAKVLEYETVIWAYGRRQGAPRYRPSYDEQLAGTAVSSVAQAPLRTRGAAAYAPPPSTPPRFVLAEETYVIASTTDLHPRLDLIGHATRGEAELALRAHLASAPGDAGALQVVPTYEAAA